MRRPTALVLGTLAGALLMTAARLGTASLPSTDTVVAEGPLDPGAAPSAPVTGAPDDQATVGAGPTPEHSAQASGTGTPPTVGPITTTGVPPGTGLTAGTFTGSAVTHKYGTLQITIVVSGGAISDIRWAYETSLPLSKTINADALPKLRTEALSLQSARVQTVSGATYTSGAYRTSLQSAIDKAK
jgi:uncharacterized protein with FMN-binding domain